MPRMTHGDFKPGEICLAGGSYECRTCAARSRASGVPRASQVLMEQRGTFPECPSCKEAGAPEVDMIWKRAQGA